MGYGETLFRPLTMLIMVNRRNDKAAILTRNQGQVMTIPIIWGAMTNTIATDCIGRETNNSLDVIE